MKLRITVFLLGFVLVGCSGSEPRKPVVRKTTSVNSESVKINKKINALEEAVLRAYAEKDSLNSYQNSAHGFWYAITSEGNQDRKVEAGDQIVFTTEILDLSDVQIYSAEEIGTQSYFVDKENIVQGLRDGLKLLHENEVAKFLFPSHKVFGFSGNNDRIEHNQPLVYKIKIIKINKEHESN
jgi:gliding motility-associated peptidyl-prolyl isomerase